MKRLATLLLVLGWTVPAAGQNYVMTLAGDSVMSPTVYEFEIRIMRVGGPPPQLASLQAILHFDTTISDGNLSFSLVAGSSQLVAAQVPNSMSIVGNELRVNPRVPPGNGNGTTLPSSNILVGRFRITSDVPFEPRRAGVEWKNSGDPRTRVFVYSGGSNVEVTDTADHLNSLTDPNLQPLIISTASPLPGATAGSPYELTFAATGGLGPITWTAIAGSVPPGMTLSADGLLSGTSNDSGLYNFTVRAADTAGSISQRAFALTVAPGPVKKLVFVQQPVNTAAGSAITPSISVRLQDSVGNNIGQAGVAVTMALSSGTGNLLGTVTRSTSTSGIALFNDLSLDSLGTKSLKATSDPLDSAESATFVVSPGVARRIGVETAPDGSGTILAAQDLAPFASVTGYAVSRDTFNNFIGNVAATWTLVNVTGGVVGGDLVPAGDGRSAAFTGHLVGSARVRAASGALTVNPSEALTVIAGPAKRLAFSVQPSNGLAAAAISPPIQVQVRDTAGNPVGAQDIPVQLALTSGTGLLSGTNPVGTDVSGVALFGGMSVDLPGVKAITASSPGLTSALSADFTLSTHTITASAGPGGGITPSGAVAVINGADQSFTITPSPLFEIANVLVDGVSVGAVPGYTFTSVTSSHTIAASFVGDSIDVTVASTPAGRTVTVDGAPYTAPRLFRWAAGSSHSIGADSVQAGAAGTRYLYANWNDAGARIHSVTPVSDTTYTVTFATQHQLFTLAGSGGAVAPVTGGWYAAGGAVQVTATPNTGYSFVNWTGSGPGSYSGAVNPGNVTMNGPVAQSAAFSANAIVVTVTSSPVGRTVIVDGTGYTTPQIFNWTADEQHTIGADSIQSGDAGTRYLWTSWSDAGARAHTITPVEGSTYTANFQQQHFLTMAANTGGVATPASGWHNGGAQVMIEGDPDTGWSFAAWTGSGTGSYSGTDNPRQISISGPVTQTATFSQNPVLVTIQSNTSGRTFTVDGIPRTTSYSFMFGPGETHTLAADSIQGQTSTERYVWTSWSDGGGRTHDMSFPGVATTVTVNFKRQFFLTTTGGAGGTVAPANAFHDSGAAVQVSATPLIGFSFTGWTGTGAGAYTGPNNPASVTMNSAVTETAGFSLAPIDVTVQTNPPGRTFTVDGVTYTGSQSFVWSATDPHTLGTTSPQVDSTTRHLFASWSDGGTQSHQVSPITDSVFTVNFVPQYFLTTSAAPNGSVTPASNWHNPGSVVQISATPAVGYNFASWTGTGPGSYSGSNNPASITMNGPVTETASFSAGTIPITFQSTPPGRTVIVDGTSYTTPQVFNWTTGSTHTISADSLQNGTAGVRYPWTSWSDAGTLTHTVSPTSATTYTAAFGTQYFVTMNANPGGTVTPPNGWFNSGALVSIAATPNQGWSFAGWTGSGPGAYTGSANPRDITLTGPITQTADFSQNSVQVTIQANPTGRTFHVDGVPHTTTHTFSFAPGENHVLSADSVQGQTSSERYVWTSWSDGGARSHSILFPGTDTTITVSFKRQFFLTTDVSGGLGGSVSPPNAYHDSAAVVQVSATPSGGYTFTGWTGTGNGAYSGPDNPASVTMNGAVTESASFSLAPINVTVRTNPPGRTFTVDGTGYTDSVVFVWTAGANHTLGTTSPQTDSTTRHLYESWSDGGSQSHTVAPLTDTSFTVNFTPQYFLTTSAGTGGSVSPASNWHNPGAVVQITATPTAGYNFASWTGTGPGSYTGPDNPASVMMNGPVTESAAFSAGTIPITLQSTPSGRTVIVDGASYTTPQVFNWTTGSTHTISADSLQNGAAGVRYPWASWSDAGERTHTVAPTSATTYTAVFGTQYFVTMVANAGGTVSPPSGWFNGGSPISIAATPNPGWRFDGWIGSGGGAYTGFANPRDVTVGAPITETANFSQNPASVTIQSNPPGRSFRVDGWTYASTYTFSFGPGENHILSTDSLQDQTPTGRFIWTSWSDGGGRAHTMLYPGKDTTIFVNFNRQFFLTTTAGSGGTVAPPGAYHDSASVVQVSATPSGGYTFTGWTGTGTGAYSGPDNPASVTMNGAVTQSASFSLAPVSVTVRTNPPGRTFSVDGTSYTDTAAFIWTAGASHGLSTTSPQVDSTTRHLFASWSDGGSQSHSVAPVSDTIFTVNFTPQYFLTTATGTGGTVAPASNWHNPGAVVQITATPAPGYNFASWIGEGSGSYSGPDNPASVTMNGPVTETASFSAGTIPITVQSTPSGRTIIVDGTSYTTPQVFNWTTGSTHTISADTLQSGTPGVRYFWSSWSDAGERTHTVAPTSATTYTAGFVTQYFVTMNANPGGTVAPPSGWFNGGSLISIAATPNPGWRFDGWTGSGPGSYTGFTNPRDITLTGPITETANFSQSPASVTIQSNPPGRSFRVDGWIYVSTYTFSFGPGENHILSADSLQDQTPTDRFVFTSWSDGGARSHTMLYPGKDTTIFVNFKHQFFLTTNAGTGGTVAPPDAFHDSAAVVQVSATPNFGYTFTEWTGTGAGAYSGPANPAGVTIHGPITQTAGFTLFPAEVRLDSRPSGQVIRVDGVPHTTPIDLVWTTATSHTIEADSIQADSAGIRQRWVGWAHGGPRSQSVTAFGDTTFTADFRSQYALTMSAGTGGTVTPPGGWYDSAQTAQISATPSSGYTFTSWVGAGTGSYSGTGNPAGVTMLGAVTQQAVFSPTEVDVTVTTAPAGRTIIVDGTNYTSPRTFTWTAGSQHTIGTDSIHPGVTGTRYVWTAWSDSGARTHTVAPVRDTTFTASVGAEHFLTMTANIGGTVAPASSWRKAGTFVTIAATASAGYEFGSWSGSGMGSFSGTANPWTVRMDGPITQIANFEQLSVLVTVRTQPAGRTFRVDGFTYTNLWTFSMLPGADHTFSLDSLQPAGSALRYRWLAWSDSGARSHSFVVPSKDTTIVATFGVQHALNASSSPTAAGTVSPAGQSFHDAGDTVSVTATSNTGYVFNSWSGAASGGANPVNVVMDTAKAITANFVPGIVVTLQTEPTGRTVTANGVSYVAPAQVNWRTGTPLVIGAPVNQMGALATRHTLQSWSDGGDSVHTIVPSRDTTFRATFGTEYYLFTGTIGSGSTSPTEGWHGANSQVVITATPESGSGFLEWTGTGPASYSGFSNPVTLTMTGWAAQIANFGTLLPPPALAGIGNGATNQPIITSLTWQSYPGATSYIVQAATDSNFTLEGLIADTSGIADTTFVLPTLDNLETYFWRIKARVDKDMTQFSETRKFSTGPAVISITSPPVNWGTGYVYPITWTSTNLSGGIHILLSRDGGREYDTLYANEPNDGSATWRAQGELSFFCLLRVVSAQNGQFFAESQQFSISSGTLPLVVPLAKTVVFPAEPTTSTTYRLVAIPGVVDTSVLLGSIVPGTHGSDWKMFADNGLPANYLEELHPNNYLSTGRGYWLVKKNNLDVSLNMTMPPLDSVGGVYRIPLRTGWNIITNPFDRSVLWSAIAGSNGLDESAVVHGYQGSYQTAAAIAPFEGYYFFNEGNLSELKIPYPFGGGPSGVTVPSAGIPGADWTVGVRYESDLNSDNGVTIGIAAPATDGRDAFEGRKPPRLLDQGSLFFNRPAWDPVYTEFATDVRPDLGEGQVWEFTVTKEQGAAGMIGFDGIDRIPAGLEAVLINPFNTTPVDLRKTSEHAFTGVARTMTFKIAVGTPDFIRNVSEELIPERIGLAQNFPNPFNSTTSISVRLPRESKIRLDVHNILGQLVTTIADGDFGPGTHTFTWEGTDAAGRAVSTGVYIYRLIEGESLVETKKMIIAK